MGKFLERSGFGVAWRVEECVIMYGIWEEIFRPHPAKKWRQDHQAKALTFLAQQRGGGTRRERERERKKEGKVMKLDLFTKVHEVLRHRQSVGRYFWDLFGSGHSSIRENPYLSPGSFPGRR